MKTTLKMLALALLVGLFGSSCATVSRLNAEYEEELVRVEKMGPEEIKEFLLSFWADQAKEHPIVSRKE